MNEEPTFNRHWLSALWGLFEGLGDPREPFSIFVGPQNRKEDFTKEKKKKGSRGHSQEPEPSSSPPKESKKERKERKRVSFVLNIFGGT